MEGQTRFVQMKKKGGGFWKGAFFTLLLLVLITIGWFIYLLTAGFSDSGITPINFSNQQTGQAIFSVQANKQQIQRLINQQIKENPDNRLSYHVEIGDQIVIQGSYRLLYTGIPFSLTFNPSVNNGDIVLKETAVKLGELNLPDQQVLAFLKNGTKFPKWVVIQPAKTQIYLNLTHVQVQKGLYLRAEKINLSQNVVSFSVHQKK